MKTREIELERILCSSWLSFGQSLMLPAHINCSLPVVVAVLAIVIVVDVLGQLLVELLTNRKSYTNKLA